MSTTETALALIENMTPAKLFEPGTIDPLLSRIRNAVIARASELDISTEKNRKALASLVYQVGRSKTFIDKQRLSLVADEKKRLKKIDEEGKRIWDELEKLQDEVLQPLTDWRESEKARIAALESQLTEIADAGNYTAAQWQVLTVEAMKDRLHEIETTAIDWQEYGQRGKLAIQNASQQILAAIAQREKYDAEQAELAQLRQEAAERAAQAEKEKQEREEKDRAEAYAQALLNEANAKAERERKAEADKAAAAQLRTENEKREAEERAAKAEADRLQTIEDARIAAEKAESDRKAEAERAERARLAAIEYAKVEQEAAIKAERERVEREQRAEADATAARERDKKHRASIHRDILKVLSGTGIDEATGKSIIELIAKGKLPHVSIQY